MSVESTPIIESNENISENILELLKLKPEQFEKLKSDIEKHDGLIRVFIHPADMDMENYTKNILNSFPKILKSEKAPPMFVFEEEELIESWKKNMSDKTGLIKNPIYMLPTLRSYPYLVIPNKDKPVERDPGNKLKESDLDYVFEGFTIFAVLLRNLGVKKILVGGTKLEIIDNKIDRCVGNFISFMEILKKHMDLDIKISSVTAPLNRQDIRDLRPDII